MPYLENLWLPRCSTPIKEENSVQEIATEDLLLCLQVIFLLQRIMWDERCCLSAVCSNLQKKRGSMGTGNEEWWDKVDRLRLLTQQADICSSHSKPRKERRKNRTSIDVWVKAPFVGHRAKKIFRPAFLSYEMADFRSSWIVSQKISWLSRQVLCVVLYERIFLLSGTNHEWTWLIVMCSPQVDGETDGDIRCYWVWCVHARSVRPCVKVLNTI